jgi:PTS system nitrogen regulatory IIA component
LERKDITLYLQFGLSRESIEFGAPDGALVHLIFMLAAANLQTKPFIHVLASISQVLRDDKIRQELLEADNPVSFAQICGYYDW